MDSEGNIAATIAWTINDDGEMIGTITYTERVRNTLALDNKREQVLDFLKETKTSRERL